MGRIGCRESMGPLNYCPDEEGIKTAVVRRVPGGARPLNYCPDEEGIKTHSLTDGRATHRFELLP